MTDPVFWKTRQKKQKKMQFKFEKGFNIRFFVIIVSFVLLVFYGIFNARNLILGPTVDIFYPNTNTETDNNVIEIKGRTRNAAFISLNEKPIFVDTDGLFQEKLLLYPGFNIIQIKARDRFKNEIQENIKIYCRHSSTTQETSNSIEVIN